MVALAYERTLVGLVWTDRVTQAMRHISRHCVHRGVNDVSDLPFISDPLNAYLDGDLEALRSIPTAPPGTPFQQLVWDALREIPAGATWSYRQLAAAIGRPSACRAVANANGRNPIPLVIPCHRVIAADGGLGGFSAGVHRKEWLLRHEGWLKD
jgi:methylated-DNA-[protein]-cysteine S-methyltransferase